MVAESYNQETEHDEKTSLDLNMTHRACESALVRLLEAEKAFGTQGGEVFQQSKEEMIDGT